MAAGEVHYPDEFVAALQAIWGDGFMSPGGPEEVAEMLRGTSLHGLSVLDIGCGVGGIDCLLVQEHKAAHVTAIDVEAQLIDHAERRYRAANLSDRITAQLVQPGPLPFHDGHFDAVFSKDAMLHIPGKSELYADILRVLKPGGMLVASDWLRGGPEDGPVPDSLLAWGQASGLHAEFATPVMTERALRQSGFSDVRVVDRHAWYARELDKEELLVTGPGLQRLFATIGIVSATQRVKSYETRRIAVAEGALRPCHLFGRKPV